MPTRAKKKKKNPFMAYLTPFGLRQICDLLILAGAITMIVGIVISVNEQTGLKGNLVAIIGFCIYALACLIAIFRSLTVILQKNINKRDPEYKSALVNACIMGVLLLLAIFGIIAAILW